MYSYEKSVRVGMTALISAVLLRLFLAGVPAQILKFFSQPEVRGFLAERLSRQKEPEVMPGFIVEFVESPPAALRPTEPPETLPPETEPPDAAELEIYNTSGKMPDYQLLLDQPLAWGDRPSVLILSTHSTESYRNTGQDYEESAAYRTLDENYNMLSIGSRVAELLEQQGIPVIRDDSLHDYPSYNGAYTHARKAIKRYLKADDSIGLILDLHRDAADSGRGQLRTCAEVNGMDSAQLMLVVGTDGTGLEHSGWQENLALALKLQVRLEQLAPGITRPLSLRPQRFNQDLSPGALLVEVGAAGNTHGEAAVAAEILAQAVAELLRE